MKQFLLIGLSLTSISLAQTTAKLEANSSVTYFASAGADKWSGKAPIETLNWEFDLQRPLETAFSATVRPAKFNSGNGIRDDNARNSVFKVARFPIITLKSSSISGDKRRLISGETRTFKAKVKLELGGITKDLEIPLEIYFDGNSKRLSAESSFVVSMDAHKLERPEFLWLKTDDAVRLEIKLETTL
jgi:polyisoprenoid-binding protein YceI